MEFQEQFDDVLALQEVATESERAGDTDAVGQDSAVVWFGDLGWCRYTD